jgi:TFIIF-interacting CTD phosphatase-like protein
LVTYRPGLFNFLISLSKQFNVFLYTAGTQTYAEPILNCIDPDSEIFVGKLYRHNCVPSGKYFLKDLGIIQEAFNIGKEKIILLDNSLISFTLCMD